MASELEALAGLALRLEKRGEGMTLEEILPLMREAEKRAILAMGDKCLTCKEIGTTGALLWELNDFRRDHTGCAPPTMMVWCDEEYGWRGWALTKLGDEVQAALRARALSSSMEGSDNVE